MHRSRNFKRLFLLGFLSIVSSSPAIAEDPKSGASIFSAAENALQEGNHERSENLLKEASELFKLEKCVNVASIYLAKLCIERKNYLEAKKYLELALDSCEAVPEGKIIRSSLFQCLWQTYKEVQISEVNETYLRCILRAKDPSFDKGDVGYQLNLLGRKISSANLKESEACFRESFRLRSEAFGELAGDTLVSVIDLAKNLLKQNRKDEAELLISDMQVKYVAAHLSENKDLLCALAECKKSKLELLEAENLLRRACALEEKSDKNSTLARNSLGLLLGETGRHQAAAVIFRELLSIAERSTSSLSFEVALQQHNLALVELTIGRYAEAEKLEKAALATYEKLYGKKHHRIVMACIQLSDIYSAEGNLQGAVEILERARTVETDLNGKETRDIARIENALGVLYLSTEKLDLSIERLETALTMFTKISGGQSLDAAHCLVNLAIGYDRKGKRDHASALYVSAINIFKQISGPGDAQLTDAKIKYACSLYEQSRYEEAENVAKDCRLVIEKNFGKDSVQAATLHQLLGLLKSRFSQETGLEHLREAQRILSKPGLEIHSLTRNVEMNLGSVLTTSGNYIEAEKHLRTAVKHSIGVDELMESQALEKLGTLLMETGRLVEAESVLQRSIVLAKKLNFKSVPSNLKALADVLRREGKFQAAIQLLTEASLLETPELKTNRSFHLLASGINNRLTEKCVSYKKLNLKFDLPLGLRNQHELNNLAEPNTPALVAINLAAYLESKRKSSSNLTLCIAELMFSVQLFKLGLCDSASLKEVSRKLCTLADLKLQTLQNRKESDPFSINEAEILVFALLESAFLLEADCAGGDRSSQCIRLVEHLASKSTIPANTQCYCLAECAKWYEFRGQIGHAAAILKTIAIIEAGNSIHSKSSTQLSLSEIFLQQRKLDEALKAVDLGLQLARNEKNPEMLSRGQLLLCEVKFAMHRFDEALTALGDLSGENATLLKVDVLNASGRPAEARKILLGMIEISPDESDSVVRSQVNTHLRQSRLQSALGDTNLLDHKFESAIESFSLAYDQIQSDSDKDAVRLQIHCLEGKARALFYSANSDLAKECAQRAAEESYSFLSKYFIDLPFSEQCDVLEDIQRQCDTLLTICSDTASFPKAYRLVQRWKGLLVYSMGQSMKRSSIKNVLLNASTTEGQDLEHEMFKLPLSNLLADDEAFVDFLTYKPLNQNTKQLAVAITLPFREPEFRNIGPLDAALNEVNSYRQSILTGAVQFQRKVRDASPDEDQQLEFGRANNAASLQNSLWKKIECRLAPLTKMIWLSCDENLAALPWSAIVGSFDVAEIDSPRAFVEMKSHNFVENPKSLSVLLAGGIDFGDPLNRVTSLPATKEEVQAIESTALESGLVPTTLTGNSATKKAVQDGLQSATYVHLATHGFFRHDDKTYLPQSRSMRSDSHSGHVFSNTVLSQSGLFLAFTQEASSESEEPGILTAEEIIGTDLSKCRLVVLSACQTGIGESIAGQGMVGLRSAICGSGARALLVSLWPVDDEATRVLMAQFYRSFWIDKCSILEALKTAQKKVREDLAHPEWKSIRYWGPWIPIGDVRAK